MPRSPLALFFVAVITLSAPIGRAEAQTEGTEFLRTNPKFLQAFREVTGNVNQSIARIKCDGTSTCLGVVVGADGWILTKAHDLTGSITCRLKNTQEFDSRIVGVHEAYDLALLKIPVNQLKPITWHRSDKARAGSWVASIGLGADPLAVGIVSVPTRKVHEAFLGIQVEAAQQGLLVVNLYQKCAAVKAGIRPKDVILRVNGQHFTDPDSFSQLLAGQRPGDTLVLTIRRGAVDKDFRVTLQSREQMGDYRAEFQNRLGSDLSNRRSGYAVILQHDSIVRPTDCGGPVVDLQGRVIGMNISRAGRVESWALPAEIVEPLIAELKSGRHPPKDK
jgi:serine protease Do